MSLELNIFINKIQRLPFPKIQDMLQEYEEEIRELAYIDQNAILGFLNKRMNIAEKIPHEKVVFPMILFSNLSENRYMSKKEKEENENELKSLDIIPLIESLQYIESEKIETILKNYNNILPSKILETLIINLPEDMQISAITMCKEALMKSEPNTFHNFIASISKEAQKFVLENFSEKFKKYSPKDISNLYTCLYQDNIPIYIKECKNFIQKDVNLFDILVFCNDEDLEKTLKQFSDQLSDLNADDLMKVICFNTNNSELLYKLWSDMPNKLEEVTIPYFKIFIRRLDDKERYNSIYDFKEKFSEMNLNEIIELFEYDTDEVKAKVLIEYRERFSGEMLPKLEEFMTETVKIKMLDIYSETQVREFKNMEESGKDLKKEFSTIVTNLKDDKSHKLFDYDYIQAIILAKILLLENKSIDDKNQSYIELREKYMKYLFNNLYRDNTVDDSINNSLFYRILKGNITFYQIYKLKTAKALIYLSRNPQVKDVSKVEDLVSITSEIQVQNYNIKLYKKLCQKIKETYEESSPLEENIKKLAYKMFLGFGYNKSLIFIEHKKSFTSLEYLFNNINVKNVKLNLDGTPKFNDKFVNYLFGNNKNDKNTNINRLLNGEIRDFDKYFSSIYNDWEVIYKKLNGNVTTKRILDLFKEPTAILKPNEYLLEGPLQEIGTSKPAVVQKAKEWYQIMQERQYSTIPKVKGNLNDYEYEILDLDNALALAVGYITRCCFLIDGWSKNSLEHSISSKNGRTFIVRKDGELIAQSWVWRNGSVLCFDNVETRGNYDYDQLLEIYKKASEELIEISNKNENKVESLKIITYGTSGSKMSKPDKVFEGELPEPLENVNYSDAKHEQCILAEIEYDNLYYGKVGAKYQDPRPQIRKFIDIKSMSDKEISDLNKQLDSIEFTITGKTRDKNVRSCTYLVCNKDWYIAIDNDGKVTSQIIKKDSRAMEEYKNMSKVLIEEIKNDKIVIPIDIENIGGEIR